MNKEMEEWFLVGCLFSENNVANDLMPNSPFDSQAYILKAKNLAVKKII